MSSAMGTDGGQKEVVGRKGVSENRPSAKIQEVGTEMPAKTLASGAEEGNME